MMRIYEGLNPKIMRLTRVICNEADSVQYVSSGPGVLVELTTASEWPPLYFTAHYEFIISNTGISICKSMWLRIFENKLLLNSN